MNLLKTLFCSAVVFGLVPKSDAQFWVGIVQNSDFIKVEQRKLVFLEDEWRYVEDDKVQISFDRLSFRFGYDSKKFVHQIEVSFSQKTIPLKRRVRVSDLNQKISYFSIGYYIGKRIPFKSENLEFRPNVGIVGYRGESAFSSILTSSMVPYLEKYKGFKIDLTLNFNYSLTKKLTTSISPGLSSADFRDFKYELQNPAIPIEQHLRDEDKSVLALPFDLNLSIGILYYL